MGNKQSTHDGGKKEIHGSPARTPIGGGHPIPAGNVVEKAAPAKASVAVAAAPSKEGEGGGGAARAISTPARKVNLEDFHLLQTVGRGSFGKVIMVRYKVDSRIYAMKALKKEHVLKRKQYEHTVSERRILENIDHPFIVSLRFAFQTEHKYVCFLFYFPFTCFISL